MTTPISRIYKIVPATLWQQAGPQFMGAPVDLADGYIHFSTAAQVAETAAKHFRGQHDLLLVTVETATLGEALKWEASRGGALFPHLYAPLHKSAALKVEALETGADGIPVMPPLA